MTKLRVRFDDPEHGWIGLSVEGENITFREAFSYTPHDSFFDLVTALSLLLEGDHEDVVTWAVGPGEFDFSFSGKGGVVRLRVDRHRDQQRPPGGGEVLFEASGSVDEICLPFWRALRDLESRFPPAELDRRWHSPFPFEALKRLSSRAQK